VKSPHARTKGAIAVSIRKAGHCCRTAQKLRSAVRYRSENPDQGANQNSMAGTPFREHGSKTASGFKSQRLKLVGFSEANLTRASVQVVFMAALRPSLSLVQLYRTRHRARKVPTDSESLASIQEGRTTATPLTKEFLESGLPMASPTVISSLQRLDTASTPAQVGVTDAGQQQAAGRLDLAGANGSSPECRAASGAISPPIRAVAGQVTRLPSSPGIACVGGTSVRITATNWCRGIARTGTCWRSVLTGSHAESGRDASHRPRGRAHLTESWP
jgi:hypothetical protein